MCLTKKITSTDLIHDISGASLRGIPLYQLPPLTLKQRARRCCWSTPGWQSLMLRSFSLPREFLVKKHQCYNSLHNAGPAPKPYYYINKEVVESPEYPLTEYSHILLTMLVRVQFRLVYHRVLLQRTPLCIYDSKCSGISVWWED